MAKKGKPFQFLISLHLLELTDERATDLVTLNSLIKRAPDSAIYFHTHRFRPSSGGGFETPNDFALWISVALREETLSERLASMDVVRCPDISCFRENMIKLIEEHLLTYRDSLTVALKGEEFHLIKPVTFVLRTPYMATNVEEFAGIIRNISVSSLAYHLFEARIRFGKREHSFSGWLNSIGHLELAEKVSRLSPYDYPSLEEVRAHLLVLLGKHPRRRGKRS